MATGGLICAECPNGLHRRSGDLRVSASIHASGHRDGLRIELSMLPAWRRTTRVTREVASTAATWLPNSWPPGSVSTPTGTPTPCSMQCLNSGVQSANLARPRELYGRLGASPRQNLGHSGTGLLRRDQAGERTFGSAMRTRTSGVWLCRTHCSRSWFGMPHRPEQSSPWLSVSAIGRALLRSENGI